MKKTRTYGDLSREEIDRIISSPEFLELTARAEAFMKATAKRLLDAADAEIEAIDPDWRSRLSDKVEG